LHTEVATTPPAEVALVQRARDGDSDAFAALVKRYQRRAVSVAYRLLGNIEDASDVSQDAFVRAFRHLSQLDDPSRFGAWLMRVVSNLALNYRRSRKLRMASPLDDVAAASAEARSPSGSKRVTLGSDEDGGPLPAELHAAITEAMEQLPDKQRLALILFSVEGMPQKEVAEILECSIELVKWNVFQARRKLKEMLEPFIG
jgi:RNA polymerase sigma-70 factor (ECF subfamily)